MGAGMWRCRRRDQGWAFRPTAKRVKLQRCCQSNGTLALDLVALQVERAQAGTRDERLGQVGHAGVVDGIRAQVEGLRLPSEKSLAELSDRSRRELQIGEGDVFKTGCVLESVREAGRGPIRLPQGARGERWVAGSEAGASLSCRSEAVQRVRRCGSPAPG